MPEIDWSKPIEVYEYATGEAVADAEVIISDLKGGYPYVVRWTVSDFPSIERVDMCSADGSMFWHGCHVRNKPVVCRKYVSLSVTKAGGLVIDRFDNKEDADHRRAYRMSSGKYVVCNVVELEWTEE